jgi:hypothetical protein
VHWFEEHPTFTGGGLVALATYESGTRFLQVGADGKITERGYFIPIGRGSTSATHWAPDGKTLYVIDYERGVDILQWTGPTYVPTAAAPTASPSPSPSPSPTPATAVLPKTSTTSGGAPGLPLLALAGLAFLAVWTLARSRSTQPKR